MKYCLLLSFAFILSETLGQIAFEEVPLPEDFSLEAVRKSPSGEYFTQAAHDYSGIYHSLDGQAWTRTSFPVNRMVLDEIRFFSDGTPVLNAEADPHLIRRNGAWHTLSIAEGDEVEASFIKQDTLFAYNHKRFAFSVDKGFTFTVMFTAAESIIDHTAHLWVSDSLILLHHSVGASDYISIYNRQGQRVLFRSIGLYPKGYLYNECGEVLIYDWSRYFLVRFSPFQVVEGDVESIWPLFNIQTSIQSQGQYYYIKDGETLYRTQSCAFDWEPLISGALLDSFMLYHVGPMEDVLLYSIMDDGFVEQLDGTNEWHERPVNIHFPYLLGANESRQGHLAARTPNALFHKDVPEAAWSEGSLFPGQGQEVLYAPNGTLYVEDALGIYSSTDNGRHFDTIPLPTFLFPEHDYTLHLLGNDVLFVVPDYIGECFYSLDGGTGWVRVGVDFFGSGEHAVKLVDNTILFVVWDFHVEIFRINLATQEADGIFIDSNSPLGYPDAEIMEDGTVYYLSYDIPGLGQDGLYRYRFDGIHEHLGFAEEMASVINLESSNNVLLAFGPQAGYSFDGTSLTPLWYSGLPQASSTRFFIGANDHAYAIVGNHRLFRSGEPLTYPQGLIGRVVHDADLDCAQDTLETGLKGWRLIAESDQHFQIQTTDRWGGYTFNLPPGTYTVSTEPINPQWEVCLPSMEVTFDQQEQVVVPDIQCTALSSCATLDLDFSTPFLRRCFDNTYLIRVRNTGPGASSGTVIRLTMDPFFDFISASHPYAIEADSIILFDLGVLEVNAEIIIRVVFNLSCDADLGMTHCLGGQLLDDMLCGNERSSYTECQENIGSYDPNDKRAFNAAGRETQTVDKDEYIYYHVRFQNTGTDTAFRVRILDTLSTRLDPRTLEMLSASHPFTHAVSDGPTLEVVFDDILLPDSNVHEAASHGFFKFRIKPYSSYDYGTMIPNDASIYFDYNEPVITPEALLVLQQPVRTSEPTPSLSFDLTPNPASDWIVVRPDPDGPVQADGYRIIDRLGRVVAASVLTGDLRVDVSRLLPGIYHFALLREGVMAGGRALVKL